MFDPASVVVGLEIGTSKVCAAVGDLGADGTFTLLGLGQCRSRGVRKGEITDPTKASEDVRNALAEAEEMAGVEIRSVYLGVTGAHLVGFNSRGIHPIVSVGREISAEDVEDAIRNAKAASVGSGRQVIHTVKQDFAVDDHDGVENPVNTVGARLEARLHLIHGSSNRLQTPLRVVGGLQIEVEQVVFNGLASALAVLGRSQKDVGALVVDLGAGTTEYALYANGLLRHSGVLALGGDHVSNDLAIGLRIPLGRAEQLKIDQGSAVVDDECRGMSLNLSSEPGSVERTINLEHLRRIQSLRVEEVLELVAREVGPLLGLARGGVFLCGGGARTPGIVPLAERIFQVPVQLGRTQEVSGAENALDQPEFATAIGLARFAAMRQGHRPPGGLGARFGLGGWFSALFPR
ncbi:MAG: cell division protein FtsA [Verrucomicrobiota bacterium]